MTGTHTNPMAERAVVGSALLGDGAGLGSLDLEVDLTDPRLVAVATAIRSLTDSGSSIDAVTVLGRMQALPEFPWARTSEVGVFLAGLASVDTCPIPGLSTCHAQSVRAATARRRIFAAGQRLQDWASGEVDPAGMADRLSTELYDLTAAVVRIDPTVVTA